MWTHIDYNFLFFKQVKTYPIVPTSTGVCGSAALGGRYHSQSFGKYDFEPENAKHYAHLWKEVNIVI